MGMGGNFGASVQPMVVEAASAAIQPINDFKFSDHQYRGFPVQPLPSPPGKGGDLPGIYPPEMLPPAPSPQPQTGYFKGDMRPAMGEFQGRPQPYINPYANMMPPQPTYGMGKGGGLGSLLGALSSSFGGGSPYGGGFRSPYGGGFSSPYGGNSPYGGGFGSGFYQAPMYAPQSRQQAFPFFGGLGGYF